MKSKKRSIRNHKIRTKPQDDFNLTLLRKGLVNVIPTAAKYQR